MTDRISLEWWTAWRVEAPMCNFYYSQVQTDV